MPLEAITQDPLSYLVAPVTKAEFFNTYHEKKALLSKHNDTNRFRDLLSIDRIAVSYTHLTLPTKRIV